jgi:protein tyrosine/serine phosphatase
MTKTRTLLFLAVLLSAPVGAQQTATPVKPTTTTRPETWAQPVLLAGVPNFHRISDHVYRSAQPDEQGFKNLEKFGIRTVISLRHNNDDEDEAEGTSLRLVRIKINTWNIDDEHVVRVMRILGKKENGPFLIHCKHGADRTGLMTAMYRMLEQNWTPQDALMELVDGGYGYHSMWRGIPKYVKSANLARLRELIATP